MQAPELDSGKGLSKVSCLIPQAILAYELEAVLDEDLMGGRGSRFRRLAPSFLAHLMAFSSPAYKKTQELQEARGGRCL